MNRDASLLDLEKPPSREEHIGRDVSLPDAVFSIFPFVSGRLLEALNSQTSASDTTAHSSSPTLPLSLRIDEFPPSSDCRYH